MLEEDHDSKACGYRNHTHRTSMTCIDMIYREDERTGRNWAGMGGFQTRHLEASSFRCTIEQISALLPWCHSDTLSRQCHNNRKQKRKRALIKPE